MSDHKKTRLTWRDEEDLQGYAAQFRSLSMHGQSYEFGHADPSEVPSFPSWFRAFNDTSEAALARSIHVRLTAASELYKPAAVILLALHDPASILCDGKTSVSEEEAERIKSDPTFKIRERLDVGRRLGVYACTWSADEARRWRDEAIGRSACDRLGRSLRAFLSGSRKGGKAEAHPLEKLAPFVTLSGRRPVEILASMADAKRRARGAEALMWAAVDQEACLLVEASVKAWNETEPHRMARGKRRVQMRTDRLASASDLLAAVGL